MSPCAINYDHGMGRWQPDAQGRLEEAAFALFTERGYDHTTVAEIAQRAGLTKRTFFRYYADKREVLFWGSEALQELLVSTVAGAPHDAAPLDAIAAALEAAAGVFEARGDRARRRAAIIAASDELRERELIKLASLATAMAQALRQRGVGEPAASLAAESGIAVLRVAFERWVAAPDGADLREMMRAALDELRAVAGAR